MSDVISPNLLKLVEDNLNSTIIKNHNVFTPHYYPNELPHRQKEVETIIGRLVPVLSNQKPNNLFLYGKSGTGKTAVASYVTSQLKLICEDRGIKLTIKHINCKANNTRYAFLRQIPNNRNLIPQSGWSLTQLHEAIEQDLHSGEEHILLIADEVDQLKHADDIMYRLSRVNDERKSENLMTFIAISNDIDFRSRLSPRTKSALCEDEIIFHPYNATEMFGILQQRAKLGLVDGAVRDKELKLISAWAARESGDARYALKLLEKSATITQESHKEQISKDDIIYAKDHVEVDLTCQVCERLPEQEQVLMLAVTLLSRNNGQHPVLSGEAYTAYEKLIKRFFPNRDPMTLRWMQVKLGELEQIGLVSLTMSGKGFRGKSRFIQVTENKEAIEKYLRNKLGLAPAQNLTSEQSLGKWS